MSLAYVAILELLLLLILFSGFPLNNPLPKACVFSIGYFGFLNLKRMC